MKKFQMLVMKAGRRLFRNTPVQRWPLTTFIYKRLAISVFGTEPIEVDFREMRIYYPGGDHTTLPTLITGAYEARELDHLQDLLDNLDTPIVAVDVGANVGIWTVFLARHPMVQRVKAFEPSKGNVDFLYKNLELNNVADKVQVIQAAVCDKDGETAFDSRGAGATMRISPVGTSIVPTMTLNEALRDEQVGLIKVDVEGFEVAVLDGAWSIIERDLPSLYIEYSLAQTNTAGLSWAAAVEKLLQIYGCLDVIEQESVIRHTNFGLLEHDTRLLNLHFSQRISE